MSNINVDLEVLYKVAVFLSLTEIEIYSFSFSCFERVDRHQSYIHTIRHAFRPYEDLITTVRKHKLRWYGYITRSSGLEKMILQSTVQGGRRMGRQKKRWDDNISEWTGLGLREALRKAEDREEGRKVGARSSLMPPGSFRLRDG